MSQPSFRHRSRGRNRARWNLNEPTFQLYGPLLEERATRAARTPARPHVLGRSDHRRQKWLDQFDQHGWEVEEIRDCGDQVLAVIREQAIGKASGAPVDALLYQVLTFRDGKLLRYQEFSEKRMALEAAGLRE